MLDDVALIRLLEKTEIIQRDKLLLILYSSPNELSIAEIKIKAVSLGKLEIQKWNISDLLKNSRGLVTHLKDKWVLVPKGKEYLEKKGYFSLPPQQIVSLRVLLPKIQTKITREFLEEAIGCFEAKYYRAAIVLSWAGAMYILREYVVNNKLVDFNAEALRRTQNNKNPWKPAKDEDELGKMGDTDFLEILDAISVITKAVKQNLLPHANTRNACAHPSSLILGDNQVSAFLESLINHIFLQFV